MKYITLGEICKKGSSNIAQKDLEGNVGDYEIYGASGFIKKVDFYHQENPYIAIVKDGAGVGRTMILPAKSSVIGTMQYILPNDDIDIRYLYYAISNMNLGKYYMGAAIPHIYFKDYQSEQLPVRDIDEQKQIADVLAKTDALIADRQAQLIKLDELVKSRFIELFGEPMENPHNYPVKRIDEVAELVKGITYSPEEVCDKDGIVVLRSSNIKGSTFDLQDIVVISKKVPSEKLVKENDILMCNRNGSARLVGKVALIPKLDENMTFGTFMTIVRSQMYKYLFVFFQMEAFRRQIQFQTAVAINQISLPLLAGVTVPIPPLELQEQFAAFVEQTDKSKLAVQQSLEKLETLKKSLIQQYFG